MCPLCRKRFQGPNRQYVLTRHLSTTHALEKPYHCPHCPYRAARRDHVSRHVKMVHTPRLHALAAAATLAALPHQLQEEIQQLHLIGEAQQQQQLQQSQNFSEVQQHNE